MRSPSRRPLRFTSVEIENWRNFRRAAVELPRRVFLIGPNASGKSNFLDVFRFLQDISAAGGGFQHAVSKRGGVSSLRCLAARRYPDVKVVVRIGDDDKPAIWEYELRFKQDNQRRPIIARERVTFEGRQLLSRPGKEDESDPARLTQTYLEQVNVNKKFRQIADFVASVRYLHVVPQLIREPDRLPGRRNDPFGGDFLEQVAGKPQKTREAWLRRIGEAMKVAVPQLQELELVRDTRGTPHLRGKYEHWRPQGAWQTEDQFSDGTLRLMGLLWALLEGSGPLLLEEPELSLHPDVVRYIPQMFARVQRKSGRQAIVSTHSNDLLADPSIGLDEVLLLVPGTEGTDIHPAKDIADIQMLIDGGVSLAEALIPLTRPKEVQQLALFTG